MHQKRPSPRDYPPLYEKLVPLALGVISLTLLGLLVMTIGVIFALF